MTPSLEWLIVVTFDITTAQALAAQKGQPKKVTNIQAMINTHTGNDRTRSAFERLERHDPRSCHAVLRAVSRVTAQE